MILYNNFFSEVPPVTKPWSLITRNIHYPQERNVPWRTDSLDSPWKADICSIYHSNKYLMTSLPIIMILQWLWLQSHSRSSLSPFSPELCPSWLSVPFHLTRTNERAQMGQSRQKNLGQAMLLSWIFLGNGENMELGLLTMVSDQVTFCSAQGCWLRLPSKCFNPNRGVHPVEESRFLGPSRSL